MDVHEVLVAARNAQERRGYDWGGYTADELGPCCPECSIADALGGYVHLDARDHPASAEVQRALGQMYGVPGDNLSHAVKAAEVKRGVPFTLGEVLAVFDAAIAATAPAPADPFPEGVPVREVVA